jgi:hypothetical protein
MADSAAMIQAVSITIDPATTLQSAASFHIMPRWCGSAGNRYRLATRGRKGPSST